MRESGEWPARQKEELRCGGSRPLLLRPPTPTPWTRYGSLVASSSPPRRGMGGGGVSEGGFVEVVLLALSLERARQFIKAFGERGGNLHVT